MTLLSVAVALSVFGLWAAILSSLHARTSRVQRALAAIHSRPADPLGPSPPPHRQPRLDLPFPFGYLNRRLREGAIALDVPTAAALTCGGALVCWAFATLLFGTGWLSALGLLGGFWVPIGWIDAASVRRREQVAREMERLVAAMEGAVGAGLSPYEALEQVAEGFGGILGPELRTLARNARRVGLSEALLLFRTRLPVPEVQLLAAGLRLHQEAGVATGQALHGLAQMMRQRREAILVMQSATSSGRMQANLLIAIPPALLLLLRLTYPTFLTPLFGTLAGNLVLGACTIWALVGYGLTRRIVTPRLLS